MKTKSKEAITNVIDAQTNNADALAKGSATSSKELIKIEPTKVDATDLQKPLPMQLVMSMTKDKITKVIPITDGKTLNELLRKEAQQRYFVSKVGKLSMKDGKITSIKTPVISFYYPNEKDLTTNAKGSKVLKFISFPSKGLLNELEHHNKCIERINQWVKLFHTSFNEGLLSLDLNWLDDEQQS